MNSTVLLLMDDHLFLKSLCGSLKRFKTSVVTANNKHEALELCSNHEVDLALLDIRQQGNDAMQVLACLKKNQPGTEVILLSDTAHVAQAMEGMRQGACDDITVPIDIEFFRKKIQAALKRRKARLKASRKRTMMHAFEDAMVAVAFAEAGELETARKIYRNSPRVGENPEGQGK